MHDATSRSWRSLGPRPSRNELLALLAILAVFGIIGLKIVAEGAPLGHDEAVYALKSRQMHLGGTSAWYWNDFRAPGLPLLLQITWLVRGSEPFLRMSVWAFGALGVMLTWLLGRSLFDRGTGLTAAAGLALASPWLASSTAVWPDVPGAVLGLGAIAIIFFATDGERTSWWVLASAPVALLAVLVRYGAVIPMGVAAVVLMIWRGRKLLRSLRQFVVLGMLVGGGSLLILLVPAVVGASTSPLSSIRALQAENDFPITQGIRDYIGQADIIFGGYAGLLLILGLALAALYAIREPNRRRQWGFLMWLAGATTLALVIVLHGEYRYLAPVYPVVWIIAGWGLTETARRIPKETGWLVGLLLAVLVPLSAASHADFDAEHLEERFGDLRVVSRAIDSEHGYEDCGVITSYTPQVAWYSGCVTRRFEETPVLTSPFFTKPQADYMLLVTGGKRQPEGDSLAAYLALTDGVFIESGDPNAGNLEYAVVYELADEG